MSYHQPIAGLCAATALFVCGAAGFPVPPSMLPASEGQLELGAGQSIVLAPGAELTVTGAGFADRAAVTVAMYSTPVVLAQTTADLDGEVSARITVPSEEGTHTLVAIGLAPDMGAHNVQSEITIRRDHGALAETGLNTAAMIAGVLVLLVSGFALVRTAVFGRRLLPQR